ncbi:hypothetical protein BH24ACT26_BH24ACT26_19070 [soil metagenome]
MTEDLQALVEGQDFNALLRAVDAACEARSWDALNDLAERCEEATERGKQLWPIAAHIDYRLALEAPAELAALVLHPEVGRFALGPLTEVAASTHAWDELAPHIELPQVAAYVAQERVLRGEVLVGDARAHVEVLELPLELHAWEPTYALATFKSTFVEVAEPWDPGAALEPTEVRPAEVGEDDEVTDALLDLVQPWTTESNGAARAVAVEGDAAGAASRLTLDTLRMGRLTPAEALQRMAWAAASGGAHGRRRGAALGRFLAWYSASLLGGVAWPVEPTELGAAATRLRWYRWDEGAPEQGWVIRLAIEDPDEGWAWALAASDVLAQPDDGPDASSP